jgi:hypothetical protein
MSVENTAPRRTLWAERVAYTNGMLLDEADFETEQSYHRGRLSMIARYLHGTGTAAGLNVEPDPEDPRRIVIMPGLGVDRAGRIIQSPLMLCLNLDNWYADRVADDPDAVKRAFNTGTGGAPDHVLCDVFLGFRECETAKRPAFDRGDFDALGSVAPLRLRDAVEASLVLREEADPQLPRPDVPKITTGGFAARQQALDEYKRTEGWLEDIWWDDFDSEIRPDREHPNTALAADIFLARIQLPATDGTPPALATDAAPIIDNSQRRMVYSTADLIALGK